MGGETTIAVRCVSADDLALSKRLRLAALADAPDAFLSTFADESAMSDEEWQARLDANVAGAHTAGFFAVVDGVARGLVVGVRREDRPDTVNLNALWVAPDARARGAGRALVEAVCTWARALGCSRVALAVGENNEVATMLYRRCGFTETKRRVRTTSARSYTEVSMALRL